MRITGMPGLRAGLAALAVAGLVAAGCGGGDDSDSATVQTTARSAEATTPTSEPNTDSTDATSKVSIPAGETDSCPFATRADIAAATKAPTVLSSFERLPPAKGYWDLDETCRFPFGEGSGVDAAAVTVQTHADAATAAARLQGTFNPCHGADPAYCKPFTEVGEEGVEWTIDTTSFTMLRVRVGRRLISASVQLLYETVPAIGEDHRALALAVLQTVLPTVPTD